MRYFEGRTVGEVAAALGVAENTAGRRLLRATAKLRATFAAGGVTVPAAGVGAAVAAVVAATASPAAGRRAAGAGGSGGRPVGRPGPCDGRRGSRPWRRRPSAGAVVASGVGARRHPAGPPAGAPVVPVRRAVALRPRPSRSGPSRRCRAGAAGTVGRAAERRPGTGRRRRGPAGRDGQPGVRGPAVRRRGAPPGRGGGRGNRRRGGGGDAVPQRRAAAAGPKREAVLATTDDSGRAERDGAVRVVLQLLEDAGRHVRPAGRRWGRHSTWTTRTWAAAWPTGRTAGPGPAGRRERDRVRRRRSPRGRRSAFVGRFVGRSGAAYYHLIAWEAYRATPIRGGADGLPDRRPVVVPARARAAAAVGRRGPRLVGRGGPGGGRTGRRRCRGRCRTGSWCG